MQDRLAALERFGERFERLGAAGISQRLAKDIEQLRRAARRPSQRHEHREVAQDHPHRQERAVCPSGQARQPTTLRL
jgi:hypothetical protein